MLKVTDIGKCYKKYNSQLARFGEVITGGIFKQHKTHWVLENINFEVLQGQSVGIIGRNGAGKSTLLKIISGTTKANTGSISYQGRIAAILELGMGFDYELTGRQNAVIGLHLLGVNGAVVNQKLQDIEEFSELGSYFDETVRVYSSGMLVRLAFSIATSSDPDLLIVDEALSVGDSYFQQKCTFVIEQFKRAGGTLLFVSHEPNMIKSLCDYAVLIDGGRIVMDGSPKDVIDFYQANILALSDKGHMDVNIFTEKDEVIPLSGTSMTSNGDAELISFSLLNDKNEPIKYIESEKKLVVEYQIKLCKDFERPAFGIVISDKLGISIYETSTYAQRHQEKDISSEEIVTVRFEFFFNLFQGQYSFSVGVANKGFSKSEFEEYSLFIRDIGQIQVLESINKQFYGGIFNMKPHISLSLKGKGNV